MDNDWVVCFMDCNWHSLLERCELQSIYIIWVAGLLLTRALFSFRCHELVIKHELIRESYVLGWSFQHLVQIFSSIVWVCVVYMYIYISESYRYISDEYEWPTYYSSYGKECLRKKQECGMEWLSVVGAKTSVSPRCLLCHWAFSLVCVCNINPLAGAFSVFEMQPRCGCWHTRK